MLENLHEQFNKLTNIPEEDWKKFEQGLQYKKYSSGDFFLRHGQISEQIGIVTKGLFRMFSIDKNKEVNYNFFAEGQFVVDYESYLKNQPSLFLIEALEDSEVYLFTRQNILQQYDDSHAWERFGRLVTEQIFLKSRARLKEMLFLNARQRYLLFVEQYDKIYDRVPQYHIASYLGIDATSLSRIRRLLAKK